MSSICHRCGSREPGETVIEAGLKIPVCSRCVRPGDTIYLELPSGDAVATVEPRCNL
jgi:hypothetical protein